MKNKKLKLILGIAITGVFVTAASNIAQAYWAWGATWTNPPASRYIYIWDGTFSAVQETTIKYAALQYDSSNTNAISSTIAGSSVLTVSGTVITTNPNHYENANYKITILPAKSWDVFDTTVPAITSRNTCDDFLTATQHRGNRASVYLNSAYNFSTFFNLQSSTVDLYTIALHEFGHTHGLGHPDGNGSGLGASESRSVMHPNWTIKRKLTLDDVNGLESIY